MGPDGGAGGGQVIAEGTPEQVALVKESFTGQFLAKKKALDESRTKRRVKKSV
jgi:excinuclease ABC subunit A